jgi:hypothetical protein
MVEHHSVLPPGLTSKKLDLPVPNDLAYSLFGASVAKRKSFVEFPPGANVITLFTSEIYECL